LFFDFEVKSRNSFEWVPEAYNSPFADFSNFRSYLTKHKTENCMSELVNDFNSYRSKMNEVILAKDNLVLKRFWSLDNQAYANGALNSKTKELLGLVSSMVLRCDDCIKYHLGKCHELGTTTEEMYEVFTIANLVGGSIVIPHTRRAAEYWEELIK
jgi:AhpD family alkylhydroperoxidase